MQSQGIVNRKNYNDSVWTSNEWPWTVDSISFYDDGVTYPSYNCGSWIYTAWIIIEQQSIPIYFHQSHHQ